MPGEPATEGGAAKRKKRRPRLVNGVAGAVTHTLKAVSIYSAFSKLAQVLPLIVGLLVIALSPTAWLSGTLRRWGVGGMLLGGALGVVVFYMVSRRPSDHRLLATRALVVMVIALAALRFHLALADVAFTERNAGLRAVHDFFVGTGDLQEWLYNVLAAFLFAAAMFAASLGLPALVVAVVRDRRTREAAAKDAGTLDAAKVTILNELVRVFEGLEALRSENARLREENRDLRRLVQVKAAVPPAPVDEVPLEAVHQQLQSVQDRSGNEGSRRRTSGQQDVTGAKDSS